MSAQRTRNYSTAFDGHTLALAFDRDRWRLRCSTPIAHPEYINFRNKEALSVLRRKGYTKQEAHSRYEADGRLKSCGLRDSATPTLCTYNYLLIIMLMTLTNPTVGFNAIWPSTSYAHDGTVLPDGAHHQMATYAVIGWI